MRLAQSYGNVNSTIRSSVKEDIRRGLRDGFPVCCIISWVRLQTNARRSGIRLTDDSYYVPCGVYHKPHFTFNEWQNLILEGWVKT